MELIELLLNDGSSVVGIMSMLGAVAVLLLSTKFPRRREFEERTARLHERLDALETRIESHELLMQRIAGQLDGIDGRLKSLDEKIVWRIGALENQVTILLRGHLDWE